MQAHAAAGDFSGAALVARNGRILYQHAFGYANLEWKIPNDLQTKFEIGSMTKQFTALLILQFVNEGKIKLDGHSQTTYRITAKTPGIALPSTNCFLTLLAFPISSSLPAS